MPSGSDELGSTYVRSEPHATRRAAKEAVSRPDRYPAVESHLPNRLKGIAIVTIFAGELICVGPANDCLAVACYSLSRYTSIPHESHCDYSSRRFGNAHGGGTWRPQRRQYARQGS